MMVTSSAPPPGTMFGRSYLELGHMHACVQRERHDEEAEEYIE